MFTYSASSHGSRRWWAATLSIRAACVVHLTHDTEEIMPERGTMQRARQKLRSGRSASTAAGEFVREEMEHIRESKHGARSTKQAIAIGLSKARRSGVPLRPPREGSRRTRRRAERDYEKGQRHSDAQPS